MLELRMDQKWDYTDNIPEQAFALQLTKSIFQSIFTSHFQYVGTSWK